MKVKGKRRKGLREKSVEGKNRMVRKIGGKKDGSKR
jgi:hypothetical protein